MSVGLSNLTDNYYLNYVNRQSKSAQANNNVDFNSVLSARATEKATKTECSFKDMWQSRFPGAYYHTMDASNIPQGVWERNDFPFEKFFQNNVDESVLNWKPNGGNPAMDSSGVQSRLHSISGQKSIVVPPELEEKMKNNPELAQQVMAKVENFIAVNQVPGRICSHLIVLDENGEIARFRASSHGGNFTGPTEAEMRQFEAEQAAKRKRRAEYMQIVEESSLKRTEIEQEQRAEQIKSEQLKDTEQHYQQSVYDKLIESYEKGTLA